MFVSPECAVSRELTSFMDDRDLRKLVKLVAIDEAHCVSEWSLPKDFANTIFVMSPMP